MWQHVQAQLDILDNQQQISQELTATAQRMLETAEVLLQAAQQVQRPPDDSGAPGRAQPP
jgi:hypothetical protein